MQAPLSYGNRPMTPPPKRTNTVQSHPSQPRRQQLPPSSQHQKSATQPTLVTNKPNSLSPPRPMEAMTPRQLIKEQYFLNKFLAFLKNDDTVPVLPDLERLTTLQEQNRILQAQVQYFRQRWANNRPTK